MEIDMAAMAAADRYKLLIGVIVPRPIAFVSSRAPDGRFNAAPFSFFNIFGEDPPTVVLGINNRASGRKDTDVNIHATGEFVINLVTAGIVEAMNLCSADLPPEVDEFAVSGLTPAPSVKVAAPRIAESPVNLECRHVQTLDLGPGRRMIVGEIVHAHVRDDLVGAGYRVDPAALDAIGRFGGPWYTRTRDLFQLERPRAEAGTKAAR